MRELNIREGLTPAQIEQLIDHSSSDSQVRKFTSDPKRFANLESFEKWREKGRSIYTLVDEAGGLEGIIWLGEEPLPSREFVQEIDAGKYGITFAIRTYGEARGRRLALSFMHEAIARYKKGDKYQGIENKGIWLETYADNAPAVKTYERFDFKQVTKPDERGRILMILREE